VTRAARTIHDEQALGGESAAGEQALDPRPQRLVGQRPELVEQRGDDSREEHQHQQLKATQASQA